MYEHGAKYTIPDAEMLMKIGILGAGHIGGTLTKRLTSLGHSVSVANSRGPDTLADLEKETGAHAVTAREAPKDRDLVIITIPEKNVRDLPADLFAGVPEDTIVVDRGNYYPQQRDGRIDDIEQGMAESRWMSEQIGRPVVKAFNNIFYNHLLRNGRPAGAPDRIALPVAADRPRDKEVVMQLIDELGFDPVDAGTIDESWRQQPGTPVYTADLDAEGVRRALDEASPERKPEFSLEGKAD